MNQFQILRVWLIPRSGSNLVICSRATPSLIENPLKSIASQNSANSQTSQGFTDPNGCLGLSQWTGQTQSVYPDLSLQAGASHQSHLEMISSHRIVIESFRIEMNSASSVRRPSSSKKRRLCPVTPDSRSVR